MTEKTTRSAGEIKAEYIKIYTENIMRDGSDKLLDYLVSLGN